MAFEGRENGFKRFGTKLLSVADVKGKHDTVEGEDPGDAERNGVSEHQRKGLRRSPGFGGGGSRDDL